MNGQGLQLISPMLNIYISGNIYSIEDILKTAGHTTKNIFHSTLNKYTKYRGNIYKDDFPVTSLYIIYTINIFIELLLNIKEWNSYPCKTSAHLMQIQIKISQRLN